jgi:hypothetical protein
MIMKNLSFFLRICSGLERMIYVKNLYSREIRDTNHNGYDDDSEHNIFTPPPPVSPHKLYQKPLKWVLSSTQSVDIICMILEDEY